MEPETGKPCELRELVRGSDRQLVEEMTPLVQRESVSLDLSCVERIDAAGIAALISLYRIADESGHQFSVSNAGPHVAELLALVGLDRILLSRNAKQIPSCGIQLAQNAA
jgi:anti-anti-sigma factor